MAVATLALSGCAGAVKFESVPKAQLTLHTWKDDESAGKPDAHSSTKLDDAFSTFEAVLEECGLPLAIRTDKGSPFASRALFGLTKLSVWWMRLGIRRERTKPGNPRENQTWKPTRERQA